MDPFGQSRALQESTGGIHKLARLTVAPNIKVPSDRRIPFGWRAFPVAPPGKGPDVQLVWTIWADEGTTSRLRLTCAWDLYGEVKIEAVLNASGRIIGTFDIRQSSTCTTFELPLNVADTAALFQEGLRLRMVQGDEPLWFFYEDNPTNDGRHALMPHMVLQQGSSFALAEFYNRMASRATIQPFGLREGCVLDGLWELRQAFGAAGFRPAMESHLRTFFDPVGRLIYEKPHNFPGDGSLWSVRGILPYATLARIWPTHPGIDSLIEFVRYHRNAMGVLQDEQMRIDDCFTICYPLAVLGRLRRIPRLTEEAFVQLQFRRRKFAAGADLYRTVDAEGKLQGRNWSRGVGWYLLGTVRTILEAGLTAAPTDAKDEAVRVAQWCMSRQLPSGLWSSYFDEPELVPDTWGSAVIAAALAHGATKGLLPAPARNAAIRAMNALLKYLAPDGLLAGAMVLTHPGQEPRHDNYRVITSAGMGMLAQVLSLCARGR